MRKEPFGVGSFVHVINRGTRGLPIVRDKKDCERFLCILTHTNDVFEPENWSRDIRGSGNLSLVRPDSWPEQEKLVRMHAFCLLTNHFHLLLEEVTEGGVAKFMQRVGTTMSKHFNQKYKESGSLFQGSYRSRTINSDTYLTYVSAYIQTKNAFDMYRGGLKTALKDFDAAYEWALAYPYSSLGDYAGKFERPIIDREMFSKRFTPAEYREFCKDFFSRPESAAPEVAFE